MNKKLLTIAIVLVIFAIVAAPVSATLPDRSPLPNGKAYDTIWSLLQDLQNQITNIQLKPGPQGPQGPAGADGAQGLQGPAGSPGATVHFGDWYMPEIGDFAFETEYRATSDGFVVVGVTAEDGIQLFGGTGPVSPLDGENPDNIKAADYIAPGSAGGFIMPVRNGDYWEIWINEVNPNYRYADIKWLPLST